MRQVVVEYFQDPSNRKCWRGKELTDSEPGSKNRLLELAEFPMAQQQASIFQTGVL